MFDTTVFNRIALHLAEIAAQLKKANELKQIELNRTHVVGPITTIPATPAPMPSVGWPQYQPPYTLTSEAATVASKKQWPFPTNDRP